MNEALIYKRQPPIFDSEVFRYHQDVSGQSGADPHEFQEIYLDQFYQWILQSKLNRIDGLETFPFKDFCVGVTSYIDDLYMRYPGRIRYFDKEYSYHWRLGLGKKIDDLKELKAQDQLVISAPFCYYGAIHPRMGEILDYCNSLGIDVHIDSAWFGCVRNFHFDYGQACIKSAGFSLSKGLSSGHHRMGIRFARERAPGPITIANDFKMNSVYSLQIGRKLMSKYSPDFLQNKYFSTYQMICEQLNLRQTNAIHIAFGPHPSDGEIVPVGVGPILKKIIQRQSL